jgi:hypothetical protein
MSNEPCQSNELIAGRGRGAIHSEIVLSWVPGFVTASGFLYRNCVWTPEQAEEFAGFLLSCADKARGQVEKN